MQLHVPFLPGNLNTITNNIPANGKNTNADKQLRMFAFNKLFCRLIKLRITIETELIGCNYHISYSVRQLL